MVIGALVNVRSSEGARVDFYLRLPVGLLHEYMAVEG